jgi:hypothetical protein
MSYIGMSRKSAYSLAECIALISTYMSCMCCTEIETTATHGSHIPAQSKFRQNHFVVPEGGLGQGCCYASR